MTVMSIALQGLQTNMRGLLVAAHNVANVTTDGYRAQRFDPASGHIEPRNAEPVASGSEPPPSDVNLATEFVSIKAFETGFRANAAVIQTADRVQRTLLDVLA